MERNPRADAIIARFTDDPQLIEEIYQHMADFQAGNTSLKDIIAKYTSDPELTAKIMANVQKTQVGHSPMSLTAYETPDATHATQAAGTVEHHKGVIEHIVTEHDSGRTRY